MSELSPSENQRYSRHLLLPEVGKEGQQRLKTAHVLVCGAGGLGAPALMYLAAAGVGDIGVAEFDTVERSNLQRQIIYADSDVGKPKADRAVTRLRELNPDISLTVHGDRLSQDNVENIVKQYDVIVDGTDNFSTRYLLSDAAILANKPYVYGSIYRFDGQASVFKSQGPCYRCLFPVPPAPDAIPNCAEGGVLGVLAGTIGSIQATECLKLILGCGESLHGRLLLYDALSMQFDVLSISKDPKCPLCGDNASIKKPVETIVMCSSREVPPEQFEHLRFKDNCQLIDVRNPAEYNMGHLPEARLIPLPELESSLTQLDPQQIILVYCRSGMRSGQAAELLTKRGFSRVYSLAGGLLARSRRYTDTPPL